MSLSTRVSIAWPPDIPPAEDTNTLVLSFPSNHFIDLRPVKSFRSLDWGMAGYQSTIQTAGGDKSIYLADDSNAATFIHIIDSRVPEDPLSVQVEGLFNKLPNGDDLETGTMMNPNTGQMMAYEEIWRTIPVTGKGFVLLESIGAKNKTFIGQIGNYFQGIGLIAGKLNAKRCEFKNGNWETVFSIGDENTLPVNKAQDTWKEGDEIEFEGRLWKVHDFAS